MLHNSVYCAEKVAAKGFLTIVKIADGGAVLAAGGIVDLSCVPPGLRRDLFFCAGTGAHLLT